MIRLMRNLWRQIRYLNEEVYELKERVRDLQLLYMEGEMSKKCCKEGCYLDYLTERDQMGQATFQVFQELIDSDPIKTSATLWEEEE